MKMKHVSSLFSFALALSPQQSQTIDKPALSPVEEEIIARNGNNSYIDVSKNSSALAEIAAEISSWDADKNSPICQLHKHITDGHTIALKDAVLETLAYAEGIIAKRSHTLSQKQLDSMNDALNMLAREIENGDLAVDASSLSRDHAPIIKIREKLYVLDRAKFFDEVTFKDEVTINGSLSSADLIIGCDVTVGCNISMNDSISGDIGNIIKNGAPFIHTFPPTSDNTFVGTNAGNFTNTGDTNSGFGFNVLTALTSGDDNTAMGTFALSANTAGSDNTAIGYNALLNNTDDQLTAIGSGAMQAYTNGAGGQSVAVGFSALASNVSGNSNTAVGWTALTVDVTIGEGNNTAIGWAALSANTTGADNTALGNDTLTVNTTGMFNTAVGSHALNSNTSGNNNIGIGVDAGISLTTGSGNIYIDSDVATGPTESNIISIGTDQTACYIQGINGITVAGAVPVVIGASGQLGTVVSSQRFKHDIAAMAADSEIIYQLNPVTFAFNGDASETKQYGLIAEQVDQVFSDIVIRDEDGNPYTVQYQVLPVLMLNEMIKQKAEFSNAMEVINNRLEALEQQN